MKDYKRMTMREFAEITGDAIYNRLAALEDKIENGELISTVQDEQSEQEIAFFAKHNAEVREEVVKECLQVLRDTRIASICDEYSWGWDSAIDTAIKRLAEKYCIDTQQLNDLLKSFA